MKLSFNPVQLVFQMARVHSRCMRTIVFLGLVTCAVSAQGPTGSLLVVDVENHTFYARDAADYSLLATKPGPTPAAEARNFDQGILVGDIVAVNGWRVKGTLVEWVVPIAAQVPTVE